MDTQCLDSLTWLGLARVMELNPSFPLTMTQQENGVSTERQDRTGQPSLSSTCSVLLISLFLHLFHLSFHYAVLSFPLICPSCLPQNLICKSYSFSFIHAFLNVFHNCLARYPTTTKKKTVTELSKKAALYIFLLEF